MKLAVLIGASSKTIESPLVPLGAGKHKLVVTGLKDSTFILMFEDGTCAQLGDTVEGSRAFKLVRQKQGTEGHSICIYAETVNGGDESSESAH